TTLSRTFSTLSENRTTLETRPTTGQPSPPASSSPPAALTGRTRSVLTGPRSGGIRTRTTCSTSPRRSYKRRTTASLPSTAPKMTRSATVLHGRR
ncbi:unnamed protein product, partial [Ectocarpus sp. 4 AP-2014]